MNSDLPPLQETPERPSTLALLAYSIGSILMLFLLMLGLTNSASSPTDTLEQVRRYTRAVEFDYGTWVGNALGEKIRTGTVSPAAYLDEPSQKKIVYDYLELARQEFDLEREIRLIYADPAVKDPAAASAEKQARLDTVTAQANLVQPIAEDVLQQQVSAVAVEMGLTALGQPVPPLLYHVTPLPMAVIVSPRDHIEQIANVSITAELPLAQITALEDDIAGGMNVSSLVVPIGGVGVYPTMVNRTTDLSWLAEVIAHEWSHNHLTLRPLGILYDKDGAMRVINETTTSIIGKEIGQRVIQRFYHELAPQPPDPAPFDELHPGMPHGPDGKPAFDYRAAMRETRVRADELLAQGKIEEAEAYMDSRRQVFWANGYPVRKLNQAYFAFYGAYADSPGGGSAGKDPVGAAVRIIRAQSLTLADFVHTMQTITDYAQLEKLAYPSGS